MTDSAPAKKVRLVKVVVQPVFVLDDGQELVELPHGPMEIPANEWPTYSSERFPAEVAEWERGLNQPPNRATRRASARKKAPAKKAAPRKATRS